MIEFVLNFLIKGMLKEILIGLVKRVKWRVVVERFITRAVLAGLTKLRDMTTNDVNQETINDIINSLHGKRLLRVNEVVDWSAQGGRGEIR